jgi:hypothetical protein
LAVLALLLLQLPTPRRVCRWRFFFSFEATNLIMLRAEAAVFTPKENFCVAENDAFSYSNVESAEQCSTAAPSPALGAADLTSPYWCYEDTPCFDTNIADEAALWDALYGSQFVLPDLEQNLETHTIGAAYAENADFVLAGLQDLQHSLAGYLCKVSSEEDSLAYAMMDGDTEDSFTYGMTEGDTEEESNTSAPMETSDSQVVLAPPPGLSAPPGLEDMDDYEDNATLCTPPGLEGTVAELHKKFQDAKKDKTSAILPSGTTTAMLRNIPNKYSQKGLVDRLYLAGYRGELDFIYLPIDFKNKCNVGYAFMNFRTAEACARFAFEYHGRNSRDKLPGYNSKKICEVSAARFQGCEENVRRLQVSSVMSELVATPEWLPILFDEAGEAVEFPIPDLATPKEVSQSSRSSRGRLQRRRAAAA